MAQFDADLHISLLQGTSVGMEYYGKGMGPGQFSMAQQNFIPGPVGDGMQNNMWNPQMKGQVSEASDKVVSTKQAQLNTSGSAKYTLRPVKYTSWSTKQVVLLK